MQQRIFRDGPAFLRKTASAVISTRSSVGFHEWSSRGRPQSIEVPRDDRVLQQGSRRHRKRRRSSPARLLDTALAAPGRRRSRYHSSSNLRARYSTNHSEREPEACGNPQISAFSLTLPTILTRYTSEVSSAHTAKHRDSDRHDASRVQSGTLSDPAILEYLGVKGYTSHDVERWHWLITGEDLASALEPLKHNSSVHASQTERQAWHVVPLFVFLYALKRDRLTPDALRSALSYAWSQFSLDKGSDAPGSKVRTRHGSMPNGLPLYIMTIRLLRFARMVLPEALISVARLYTKLIETTRSSNATCQLKTRRNRIGSRTAISCNRMLRLLSLPCSVHPFLSTGLQQSAQFHVLQYMAHCQPVIPVTREGYQAIARVQLASRKNPQEQDWASLKAKTWPPWKEDKIGFDAEKGPDYGVSQALHAIRHAQQAGYGSGRWEKVARILSGWNTDESPTIQTRAWLLPKTAVSRRAGRNVLFERLQWAARIQATRTVQEAWACFLAYQDQGLPPHQVIYLAMFRKLHANHLLARSKSVDAHEYGRGRSGAVQGGDAREVFPTPLSPKEGVYVRSDPPSMDDLAEQMFSQNITPSGTCLAFLVSNASSLTMGVKYLEWGRVLDRNIEGLLSSVSQSDPRLALVQPATFYAFIQLLCRCHYARISTSFPAHELTDRSAQSVGAISVEIQEPLLQALWLMDARKPQSAPPWHALLNGLSSVRISNAITNSDTVVPEAQEIERWHLSQSVRRKMKDAGLGIDLSSYRFLCRTLEKSALAALKVQSTIYRRSQQSKSSHIDVAFMRKAQNLLSNSSSYVRRLFYELFGTPDARSIAKIQQQCQLQQASKDASSIEQKELQLPRLLASPEPVLLHFYVRVLGVLGHHHMMLELVRWLVVYKDEVNAAAARPRNGQRILRRALVAIRVFSERFWAEQTSATGDLGIAHQSATKESNRTAPARTLHKIRELVESVEDWGGWPTDDEAWEYCEGRLVCSLSELKSG